MSPAPMTAEQILNREFLEIRAKILELAAAFDRLDRGGGPADDDGRILKIRAALDVLGEQKGDRAEQIQLIFSRQYRHEWPQEFALPIQR